VDIRCTPRWSPLHWALLVLLFALACGRQQDPSAASTATVGIAADWEPLRSVPFARLPILLDDGDRDSLAEAARHSLRWLRRQPADRSFTVVGRTYTTATYAAALSEFVGWLDAGLSAEALAAEVAYRFAVYETNPADDRMLITGYYEPIIDASLDRRPGYEVPLWRPPGGVIRVDLGTFAEDLQGRRIAGRLRNGRLEPLPNRAQTREGGLSGTKVLAWARNPVDAFFLEVQGSGSLRLPNGKLMRVGYAAQNGHPYKSIGRLLIDEGKVARERMSMQAIRTYLTAHPEEVDRVLDHNPSVVFFRRLDGPPVGNLGLPVVPQRVIATDHKVVPPGVLCFLDTERPALAADGTTIAEAPLRRFVFNHDTGGAIRGPGRADFFWGRGDNAAYRAGAMKQPGRLLIFVPRDSDEAAPPPA
jgi:membrane-bound lytic murein transglycosylase A